MKPNILLAEDEPFLAKVVKETLEKEGYAVTLAGDGCQGWELFCGDSFDLCILDVMMPYTDGFTLAAKIRQADKRIPLMFLTAKAGIDDIKEGYASGANDYLRKPFSLDELFLRVGELLRRHNPKEADCQNSVEIGAYTFFYHRQELRDDAGAMVKLSHKETELLSLLHKNKNGILDRKTTLLRLWGDDSYFNTRNMDVYITKLRARLKNDPSVEIVNVRGYGYKLIC